MASERMERIARGYEAWNRGEPIATDNVAPEFEFHPPPDLSGESVQRGRQASEAFKTGVMEAFESIAAARAEAGTEVG